MPHEGTPHRVVDTILDSAAGGVKSAVGAVTNAAQSLGEGIQQGLDSPWKTVGGPEQPMRIVDRLLDGSLNAAEGFVNQGVLNSLQTGGEAVQSALDHPCDQFGIPPSLGAGLGRFNMPSPSGRISGFKPPELPKLWN